MLEEITDFAYDFAVVLMIVATTFISGYMCKNYFHKEDYLFGFIWAMITVASAFQKYLWSKLFELKDSIIK